MTFSRRSFLHSAAWLALAAPAFQTIAARAGAQETSGSPLQPDPEGWLDLPEGFSYRILSRAGDVMSDGLIEPRSHDGMAAFPVEGDSDRCIIVRNHEMGLAGQSGNAFGEDLALAAGVDPALIYDTSPEGHPLSGGTTTLLVNLRTGMVERSHLSLAGTARNCAGGPTPWGSWLTCEETKELPGPNVTKPHGYVFEVPAAEEGLVQPRPLLAMGRFNHEAAAVDPATGVVYMTEDEGDSLFYRFIPNTPGDLAAGGRLQALAVRSQPSMDARNWSEDDGGIEAHHVAVGASLEVDWIDLEDTDSPNNDLRWRGFEAGAARFARGEGMAYAAEGLSGAVYFACTSGGPARAGQIWRYVPSAYEGDGAEVEAPGRLELFVESSDREVMDMCDNICAAPWGGLVVCEDGPDDEYLRAVMADGRVIPLARNAHPDQSELTGACFSPDGSTLFVNIQNPGVTFAITGPWSKLSS
ncbi:MAG: DUF839 domain-containing protein [Maricaulaceae bacterium]|jgi:secreted PhoX family phosphatase